MRRDNVTELGSLIVTGMIRYPPKNGGQVVVLNQMKPGKSNYYNEQRYETGHYKGLTHRATEIFTRTCSSQE